MITVEDLLMAFASAYDAWLDPDAERKNPVPEYAALIRQAVNYENDTLGRGECKVEWRENGWGTRTRHCGEGGADLDCDTRNRQNYCPNCGRKVVDG